MEVGTLDLEGAGTAAFALTGIMTSVSCVLESSFLKRRSNSHEAMAKLSSKVISRTIFIGKTPQADLNEKEL